MCVCININICVHISIYIYIYVYIYETSRSSSRTQTASNTPPSKLPSASRHLDEIPYLQGFLAGVCTGNYVDGYLLRDVFDHVFGSWKSLEPQTPEQPDANRLEYPTLEASKSVLHPIHHALDFSVGNRLGAPLDHARHSFWA